jgi:hypothetical protein
MSRDAEIATAGYAASPLDWYVEPVWVTRQLIIVECCRFLIDRVNHHNSPIWGLVWDPCCGIGNVLRAFEEAGFGEGGYASDLEFRGYAARGGFNQADFLVDLGHPFVPPGPLSIVMNPPFSYKEGIAEAFVRRALTLATRKVAVLVPLKWLASQVRHTLFTEHPPRTIYVLSERPSMPPGAQVEALGDAAFKRGKMDFVWIVWDVATPTPLGETRIEWIGPRDKEHRR